MLMTPWFRRFGLGGVLVCLSAAPALAQQQSVTFNLGYFAVRGEDARVADDVLVENRNFLIFEVGDFSNVTVSGEWLVGVGNYVEAGVGVGYYRSTVPSVYADYVDVDGSEIEQDLRLQIVPVTFTARVLPLGRRASVQPYVGGGLALYRWRYSETGEFIDFVDFTIFRDSFVAEATDVGGVFFGGVRVPVGSTVAIGAELRYQTGTGVVGIENGFLADEIDLGGFSTLGTVQIRF
jgi:hypothetical protein